MIDSLLNTHSKKSEVATSFRPLEKAMSTQMIVPPNKSNYFQRMNLKNIESENKILYNKIQNIVHGRRKSPIFEQQSKDRKVVSRMEIHDH